MLASVVGAFHAFFYHPLVNKQEEHRLRTEQLNTLLQQSREALQKHRQLQKQLHALQEKIPAARRRLPNESFEAEFVSQVSNIAKSVDLQIVDYQQGTVQKAATHSKAEVQFRCHGSFASICHFLHEVSQLTRITKISKFDLKTEKNSHRYPFQVTFVLYYGVPSNDTSETRGVL